MSIVNSTFGDNTTVAGRGATVNVGMAFAELAAVLQQLRELGPGLTGGAAEAAQAAEEVLADPPRPDAPAEERKGWAARVTDTLNTLLSRASQVKAAVDLAEKALKTISAA